jgi:outer membrane protein, heavy metal efflux system
MARRVLLLVAYLSAACGHTDVDHAWLAQALTAREGLGSAQGARDVATLAKLALSEDDAVALALAQSPRYRADLTRLDSARADLDEARRPSNPQLTLLGAIGPVSAMATLLAPLESLWQLPLRSKVAARALESIAHSLLQSGLDLARDARLAHIARGLAEQRVSARAELAVLVTQLSELAGERVRVGEAASFEAAALHAEAALALDALQASESERTITRAELRTVLGLDARAPGFDLVFRRPLVKPPPLRALTKLALRSRPDVRAAELSVLAAGARLGWERSRVVAVAAQLEGHWTRPDVFASRMGARVELPIFGLNPGGIGRAHAEIARAAAAFSTLRQQVALEIMRAHTRAHQVEASLLRHRSEVLPALETARAAAVQSYELGEDTYAVVLDIMRRLGEARLREAELVADARRALAELERAVGARISGDS